MSVTARVAVPVMVALTAAGCGTTAAPRARAPLAGPPKTVDARRLGPSAPGGLKPGTRIKASFRGTRVFANRRAGFAITDIPREGGGTYPVGTTDGGRTWRTVGPVLHVPAAQGPLAVSQAGVAGPRTFFAWCAACNSVIDVTADGGAHWRQAFMPGTVLSLFAVRPDLQAVVEGPTSDPRGRGASLWLYTSHDGRRWRFGGTMNAVS